jgi:hypothetical protein
MVLPGRISRTEIGVGVSDHSGRTGEAPLIDLDFLDKVTTIMIKG